VLTDQLFEQWNVDAADLVRIMQGAVGDADLFLGGSLADDLGTEGSDIDLYCFVTEDPPWTGPRVARYGPASIELHVVDVRQAAERVGSLLPLLLAEEPPPPQQWPLLTGGDIRLLHALYRDRRLHSGSGGAEWLRRQTGADLLHIHLALRATITAAALARDVASLVGPEQGWTALYCARLAVESALDAALATCGLVNPNPKWRVLLALQARLTNEAVPNESQLLDGLFPDTRNAEAIGVCLTIASSCLEVVAQDRFLMRFPSVSEAVHGFADKDRGHLR
jgi:hypothetical protein